MTWHMLLYAQWLHTCSTCIMSPTCACYNYNGRERTQNKFVIVKDERRRPSRLCGKEVSPIIYVQYF